MSKLRTIFPIQQHSCPTPGKLRFKTKDEAENFEEKNRSKYGAQRIYFCSCNHFHLTTKIDSPVQAVDPSRGLPNLNSELEEQIRQLAKAGVSVDDIVLQTNEPHSTVHFYLQKTSSQPRQFTRGVGVEEPQFLLGQRREKKPEGSLAVQRAELEEMKRELAAKEARLAAEEKRQAEESKLRTFWVPDGDANLLRVSHHGRSAVFPLDTWREALPLITEHIRQFDAGERLLPGDEVS